MAASRENVNSSVQTLEMTNIPSVVPAMCEDCACPKPDVTLAGQAERLNPGMPPLESVSRLAVASAVSADEQMPISFTLIGSTNF